MTLIFTLLLLVAFRVIKTIFMRELGDRGVGSFGRQIRLSACISGSLVGRLASAGAAGTGGDVGAVLRSVGGRGVSAVRIVSSGKAVHNRGSIGKHSIIKRGAAGAGVGHILCSKEAFAAVACSGDDSQHSCISVAPLFDTDKGAGAIIKTICLETGLRDICSSIGDIALVFTATSLVTATVKVTLTVAISDTVAHPVSRVGGRAVRVTSNSCSNGIRICKASRLKRLTRTIGGLSIEIRRTRRSSSSREHELSSILSRVSSKIVTASQHKGVDVVGSVTYRCLSIRSGSIVKASVLSILGVHRVRAVQRLVRGRSKVVISVSSTKRSRVLGTCFSAVRHRDNFVSKLIYILRSIARRRGVSHREHRFISGISRRLHAPLADVEDCVRTLGSNT